MILAFPPMHKVTLFAHVTSTPSGLEREDYREILVARTNGEHTSIAVAFEVKRMEAPRHERLRNTPGNPDDVITPRQPTASVERGESVAPAATHKP